MIPAPKINTRQQATTATVPAPIGGLNGRDPLASMAETDAYLMDNWYPNTASVVSRKGNEEFCEALGSPVQSLEVYTGAAGDKLLAFAGAGVYNISTGIPATLATGRGSPLVIAAMFSNSADNAQHLIVVNGVDNPSHYEGTSFTALTVTGMTGSATTLNYVFAFKSRLYFAQKDKLGFYYLPVGAIQGALSYFDLGQVSRLGGYLTAIASFSQNSAGSGPNDYIVFITSKGECIVYGGYDPSNAATWGLVGRYYTADPIGRKCVVNFGTELVILTLDGAVTFSEIQKAGDAQSRGVNGAEAVALTSKLGTLLSDLNVNRDVSGWSAIQYALGGWLILNVPNTGSISGAYNHFVMNTTTKQWTRFTGWDGLCFAVYNRRLYFGKYDGRVMLGDESRLDDGQPIKLNCKQAYNYFDMGEGIGFMQKHFQWATLLVSCDGPLPLSAQFNVDYVEDEPQYVNDLSAPAGAEWDTTDWDTMDWAADSRTQRFTATLNKGGVAGSLWLRAQSDGLTMEWFATQVVLEKTKGLLI